MRATYEVFAKRAGCVAASSFLCLLSCSTLCAQQADDGPSVNKETVQLLMKRIDQLEARVSELEARQQKDGAGNRMPESDLATEQIAKALAAAAAPLAPAIQASAKPQAQTSG